jgi:hypothetical protein
MRRLLAIGCCGLGLAVPAAARAAGGPVAPVVGGAGASAPGGGVNYVAVASAGGTVVERVRRADGAVRRSVFLRERLGVPGAAFDGSTTGLSADGRTLVLAPAWRTYPPRRTRLTILDAPLLRVRTTIALRGAFTVDAISPDGRWLYLLHYRSPDDPLHYQVRAYDLRTRTLLAKPIVDPREPDEKMLGIPMTRVTDPGGRWVYTLYQRPDEGPFIHALDTSGRTARCIDLPASLSPGDGGMGLRLNGPTLTVTGAPGERATVDTRTLAVHFAPAGLPSLPTAAPRKRASDDGPPWALALLLVPALLAGLTALARRRRRATPPVPTVELRRHVTD